MSRQTGKVRTLPWAVLRHLTENQEKSSGWIKTDPFTSVLPKGEKEWGSLAIPGAL